MDNLLCFAGYKFNVTLHLHVILNMNNIISILWLEAASYQIA